MPKYIKRRVINQEKVSSGELACAECGNSYYMKPNTVGYIGLSIVKVTNTDISDDETHRNESKITYTCKRCGSVKYEVVMH